MKGSLLLLPNIIANTPDAYKKQLPESIYDAMQTIDGLFAENAKEARRFALQFSLKKPIQSIPIIVMDEPLHIATVMQPVLSGETWGVVSDAGMPCIADPGYKLVAYAHKHEIDVQVFVGPSSLFLALAGSGLPAQRFSFQGYLPKKPEERKQVLLQLEKESAQKKMTQIFIETPYRNQYLLEALVHTLDKDTTLAVATSLLGPDQKIISKKVALWRKHPLPSIAKMETVFLFSRM